MQNRCLNSNTTLPFRNLRSLPFFTMKNIVPFVCWLCFLSSLMRLMLFDQTFLSRFMRGSVKYICTFSIFMCITISFLLHAPANWLSMELVSYVLGFNESSVCLCCLAIFVSNLYALPVYTTFWRSSLYHQEQSC